MTTFSTAVGSGPGSTAAALDLFDRLAPAEISDLIGSWRGKSFLTGHPLDGALEAYYWYGKRFEDAEQVHPLVFQTMGGGTASVNPLWALPVLRWLGWGSIPKSQVAGRLFQLVIGLVSTHCSCARLRLTQYRGKVSATMIYDTLPINDVFRKIDDNTLLGLMDLKGIGQPFFFTLHRETPEHAEDQ